MFFHPFRMLSLGDTFAYTALTLTSDRAFWILFAVLTRLSHSPVLIDHTKQVNHAFFECFPQTHGLPSFYSLWQTLAGRAINDTQPFALSSYPIAKRRSLSTKQSMLKLPRAMTMIST